MVCHTQVFGRLISDESPEVDQKEGKKNEGPEGMNEGDVDLKEHMVSILFSRSKLTHLQKQVRQTAMAHICEIGLCNSENRICTIC